MRKKITFKEVERVTLKNLHQLYWHEDYNLYYYEPHPRKHYEIVDDFSEDDIRQAIKNGMKFIAVCHLVKAQLPMSIAAGL